MSSSTTPAIANAVNQVPRRFAVFVVCILLITAVSTYVVTYVLVSKTFDEVQSDYTAEAFLQTKTDLTRYIETRITLLSDESERSVYSSAVMQEPTNTASLKDYMKKQVLLGQNVHLALLDINGRVVESTFPNGEKFSHLGWIENLIEGKEDAHAEILAKNPTLSVQLQLAVPVLFRGLPEGVLIAEVSLGTAQLEQALNHDLGSISLMFLTADDKLIASVGAQRSSSASVSSFVLPYSDTQVQHSIHLQSLDQTLSDLLGINMFITLALAGLFLFIFQNIGTRVFIRPQQLLMKAQRATLKSNKMLQVANDELSQFAYRSSHDLRSPLTTVQGLVDFSRADLATGKLREVDINLEKIGKHVLKLDALVAAILELSRADFNDGDVAPIDMRLMCQDIEARLLDHFDADAFDISLTNQLDRDFVSQPARVMQIVENLISNAFKYRDPKKDSQYVKLTLMEVPGGTLLVVEDNGLGIPAEMTKDVFVMFRRFHPTIAVGSGLGLSIVKKHVEQLNGQIEFDSSENGTVFKVVFPLHAGLAPAA